MIEQDGRALLVVDSQVHVWHVEPPDQPWPAWNEYVHRDGTSPLFDELVEEMDTRSRPGPAGGAYVRWRPR